MEMFDLFQFYDKNEDIKSRGWIRLGGDALLEEARRILLLILKEKYKLNKISEIISNKLGISPITINKQLREIKNKKWRGKRHYISIPILSELILLWNRSLFEEEKWKLIKLAEWASNGTPRAKITKLTKELTPELAMIAGAHAADGTLARFKTDLNSYSYLWRIVDSDKNSLESLKVWIKKVFDVDTKIEKSKNDNSFHIRLNNKVIFRYLNKILGFKIGYKMDSVSIPLVMKNSNQDLKRKFALGVMTFDGCVDVYGYARLGVKSRQLRDEIAEIMKNDGIKIMVPKKDIRRDEYALRTRIKLNDKNFLNYFAENSIQWLRVNVFIKNSCNEDAINLFKGNKNNKVNFLKILEYSKKLKTFDINLLKNSLNVSKRTLRAYLDILEKSNMIEIKNVSNKYVYKYLERPTSPLSHLHCLHKIN